MIEVLQVSAIQNYPDLHKLFPRSINLINFETNDSDNNFILLQRRFDASCIIFKLRIKYSRLVILHACATACLRTRGPL